MKKIFVLLTVLFITAACTFAESTNTEAMLQYNQGIDYYKTGQYDDAISSFRAAIKLDPNYIDAYYNLGSVLEYLQQYEAALSIFKQIIVRKPDDYDSIYKAAWLSSKLGEAQKAKTYLSIIPPNSPRAGDAKALAAELNFSLTPPKITTQQPQPKSTVAPSNELYQNITAPTGIASDSDGNVYIAEFTTNTILKITPNGKRIVYLSDAKINGPIGIAYDNSNNLYIANYNKNNVLKFSPYGELTVLISNVKKPYYLYVDRDVLYISCQGSGSVLKYKLPN